MMKKIHSRFAPLFALILLLSLLCPAFAAAEESFVEGTNTDVEIALQTELLQDPETPVSETSEAVAPSATEAAEAAASEEEQPNSESSTKQETLESAQPVIEKDSKTATSGSVTPSMSSETTGDITDSDGTKKTSKSKHIELFVASTGSDTDGDGSVEHPYSSLAGALEAIGDQYSGIDLCLMTDLAVDRTAYVVGKKVSLSSYDGVVTLSRDENFDAGKEGKETALISVGSLDSDEETASELIIEYVIIDEAGQKNDPLQDAIIEVCAGGKLILGEAAELCNYGGTAAVHGWPGSEIFVSSSARIADTMDIPGDGTVAVRADEGCDYGSEAGSVVLAHGESLSLGNAAENSESESETDELKAPLLNAEESESTTEKTTVPSGSGDQEEPVNTKEENAVTENSETALSGIDEDVKEEASEAAETLKDTDAVFEKSETTAEEAEILSASALPSMQLAEAPLLQADEPSGLLNIDYSLNAPEAISLDDGQESIGGVMGYPVPYTLSLKLSIPDSLISLMQAAGDTADIDIKLDLNLSEKLFPETQTEDSTSVMLTPNFKVFQVTNATYSGHKIQIELKPGENWLANLQELKNTLELSLRTILPANSYAVGETLTSSASVTEMTFSYGEESRTLTPSETTVSAETKLMGAKRATLIYDPNGGTGGPGEQLLPAEVNHVLETANVPTHADANGKAVLFLGWTTEKDHKIYADGDAVPDTVTTVTLEDYQTVVVYAVYSYDRNGDGIPDVNQKLITLGFDANGGKGAPDPMTQAARTLGTAEFAIPEQEPSRPYYTFLGWNEDENATEGKYKHDAARAADRDITIREDTVLYAVWEENPIYTLYFNGNGGTNVPAPQSARSENGVAELTITNQIPTRSGRTFVGWATERYGAAAFDPGEDVRLTGGDVTLYAVWERNSRWSTNGAPKTGDESNVGLYAALAIGSAGVLFALFRVLKKRKK